MMCDELLKELKILYVEDESSLSMLLKEAIGSRFQEFALAGDGVEGLEKYDTVKPDIVITDITMPRMNGLDMAEEIHMRNPKIPLVVLSAYSDKEKLLGAIDAGINKYFIKPFDPDSLLEYLCELARKRLDLQTVRIKGGFLFDKKHKQLYRNGTIIRITRRELSLIDKLLRQPGHFMCTEDIKKAIWQDEDVSNDALRVFIKRLRGKTDQDFIKNSSGEGYYLEAES